MIFKETKSGVTLINLVITIVLVIIIATISYNFGGNALDDTISAKYNQEISEVKKCVETVLLNNAKKGFDEDIVNDGFIKVKIKNDPPEGFASFNSGDNTAYVVNLSVIDYDDLTNGHDYYKFKSGDYITIGQDDIFIYDKNIKVFYAKDAK